MPNDETALEVYVEEYLATRKPKKILPFLSGLPKDPIDHITIESMRGSHNFAAMMHQNFELQRNFIRHVMIEYEQAPPAEKVHLEPIIKQMVRSLNAGVMEQAEAAIEHLGRHMAPPPNPGEEPTFVDRFVRWMKEN